jgi:hypothetical protein
VRVLIISRTLVETSTTTTILIVTTSLFPLPAFSTFALSTCPASEISLANKYLLAGWVIKALQKRSPLATSRCIVVITKIVTPLITGLSATELTAFFHTGIPIDSKVSVIERGCIEQTDRPGCVLMCGVLYKAEATGGLLESIQSHDNLIYSASLREQLIHLILGCVKRKISHVQGP